MSVALRLYEQLTEAGEDKTRAKLIAEAFEHLEDRYPQLKDVATSGQVRETELRLQKEIKEVEATLRLEIEKTRLEIREVEARLQKEIKEVEVRLTQAIHRQTLWVVGSVGAVVGLIRLLEWFLAHMPNP
jgi:flagellar motor component MotA